MEGHRNSCWRLHLLLARISPSYADGYSKKKEGKLNNYSFFKSRRQEATHIYLCWRKRCRLPSVYLYMKLLLTLFID